MHERRTPDKLPDPWLFNSDKLLHELDNCRELILKIPLRDSEVYFATNRAIDALWDLRSTLEFLLQLHRTGQRVFAEKATELQKQNPVRPTKQRRIRTEADDINTSLRRTGKPCRYPDIRTDEEKPTGSIYALNWLLNVVSNGLPKMEKNQRTQQRIRT